MNFRDGKTMSYKHLNIFLKAVIYAINPPTKSLKLLMLQSVCQTAFAKILCEGFSSSVNYFARCSHLNYGKMPACQSPNDDWEICFS